MPIAIRTNLQNTIVCWIKRTQNKIILEMAKSNAKQQFDFNENVVREIILIL